MFSMNKRDGLFKGCLFCIVSLIISVLVFDTANRIYISQNICIRRKRSSISSSTQNSYITNAAKRAANYHTFFFIKNTSVAKALASIRYFKCAVC